MQKDPDFSWCASNTKNIELLKFGYVYGSQSEFKNRNYPAASYFVGLYAMVDPENPEHSYLGACLDMANHDSAKRIANAAGCC